MKKWIVVYVLLIGSVALAAEFEVELTPTSPTCNGGSDGSIQGNIIDGAPPFTVSLIPAIDDAIQTGGTFVFANLPSGAYSVQVVDNNSDTVARSTTIEEPQKDLSLDPATIVSVLCNGASTGSISLNVNNPDDLTITAYTVTPVGGLPITITPPEPPVFTNLPAASYLTRVDAENGDCAVRSEIITQPSPIVISAKVVGDDVVNDIPGTVTISVIGGSPPYTVTLAPAATPNTGKVTLPPGIGPFVFTDVTFGNYIVTVTDENFMPNDPESAGCTASQVVSVPQTRGISANELTNFITAKYCSPAA